jgi:hypothetical protein
MRSVYMDKMIEQTQLYAVILRTLESYACSIHLCEECRKGMAKEIYLKLEMMGYIKK